MRRIHRVTVVVLILGALIFAYSQARRLNGAPAPQAMGRQTAQQKQPVIFEVTIGTQRQLNQYFHGAVIPKLRECWKRLQGEGMIEIKLTYAKGKGSWTWQSLAVGSSGLPRGQEAVASQCMQGAVRGTSFPVEAGASAASTRGSAANTLVVKWDWPVPLPANSAEFAEFMKPKGGGKTGGCDGHGAAASCYACPNDTCDKVCVGWDECKPPPKGGNVCIMGGKPCASKSRFGEVGGVIMY